MPRSPRVEGHGAIHHVVARGVASQPIVRDDYDRRAFLARLARTISDKGWACWVYCLMDNHFHLVLVTPEPNLGVGMKWLMGTYAQRFNERHGRTGHLFGGRFYSASIESERRAVATTLYVLRNPVRAGMVGAPEEWPWSSYRATCGIDPCPPFLSADGVLALFDGRTAVAQRHLRVAVEARAAG